MAQGTKKWKCDVCGYVHEGAEPPEECPQCGAAKEKFAPLAEDDEPPSSPQKWKCGVCGYVHEGAEPPDECPVCGADRDEFSRVEETEAAAGGAEDAEEAPKRWKCTVCGYIHEGEEPPQECPVCGAPPAQFELVAETPEGDFTGQAGRVVILGGGIAAVSAAEAVHQADPEARIVLVSAEERLPYYRLNLTPFLAGQVEEADLTLHPESWYEENGIELLREVAAEAIDTDKREVRLSKGEPLSYDALVLAVGAHPFVPPVSGAEGEAVNVYRTVADAKRVLDAASAGKSLVIVGGGLLGLEAAGGVIKRGGSATVIEVNDWLMPRQLNEDAARMLEEAVRGAGVELKLGAKLAAIEGHTVKLESGEELTADMVVFSAGIRPNVSLAEDAGIRVERGVVVDDQLQTSAQGVFAAGDVAEHNGVLYGIWTAAQLQGMIAGVNAAGGSHSFAGMPPSTRLKVLDTDVVSIGKVEAEDGDQESISKDSGRYLRFLHRDGRLLGAVMVGDAALSAAARDAIEKGRDLSHVLGQDADADSIAEALRSEQ